MAETVFLNEGTVQITNARFMVGGQTFAMNGVTSVKNVRNVDVQTPSRTIPIILAVIGLGAFSGSVILGILLIGAAIAIFVMNKEKTTTTETVMLSTSGGEVKALESQDTDYIRRIVSALNEAIIHRG